MRPISFLVVAIAVACVALFVLLPMSKIAQHSNRIEAPPTPLAPPAESADEQPNLVRTLTKTPVKLETSTETVADTAIVEPGVSVSGQVGDTSGAALAEVKIEVQSKGFDGEVISNSFTESDLHGNFSLQLVPARQYRLSIQAAGNYAGYLLDGFTDANADLLQKILLERVELVDIDGLIVDANSAPVADFELGLRHLNLVFPERVIRSDSSGYFSLRGFPAGEWRIATNQSDYYRIKGLELRPGEFRNLTLMIDRGNYHLAGWVRDSDGIPLAAVTVTVKSAFATDEYHSYSFRSVATDVNGAFQFSDLGGHPLTLAVQAPGFKTTIKKHQLETFADSIDLVLERE